jgi:hypothetical protein
MGGRGGQSGNVLDLSEYRSDETLLDVYTASLDQSFRIKCDAFDYSGLVSPLSFRSEVNFRAGLVTLRAALPDAKVDDDFAKMRGLLGRGRVSSRGSSNRIHRRAAEKRRVSRRVQTMDSFVIATFQRSRV